MYTDPDLNEDQFNERFRQSLDNTFSIFTGQRTYLEILLDQSRPHFFFFDPETVPTKEDVLDLIYIYEDLEEYEKCGELLNLVNQFE